MHLREERRNRIFAANLVSLVLNQVVPLAVMDCAVRAPPITEDFERDLLKTLATKSWRQVLDAKLGGESKHRGELLKQVLVTSGLVFELVCEPPQTLGLFTLLADAAGEEVKLTPQVLAHRLASVSLGIHVRQPMNRTGRSGQAPARGMHDDGNQPA
jgi:hypothetical protein